MKTDLKNLLYLLDNNSEVLNRGNYFLAHFDVPIDNVIINKLNELCDKHNYRWRLTCYGNRFALYVVEK
jgi:hypothetical protein